MDHAGYQAASDTLVLLEERLRRVQYILHGDLLQTDTIKEPSTSEPTRQPPASERLRRLERNLASLASKSPTVSEILDLQSQHPSLFHPSPHQSQQQKPDLSTPSLAALILAHSHLFQSSSTHLQTLQSQNTIPDSAAFAKLTALQPRIDQIRTRQDEQAREFAELRARSARVVEKWFEGGVLGMGEKWAEWEERLRECEILVRRREAREKREREGIV